MGLKMISVLGPSWTKTYFMMASMPQKQGGEGTVEEPEKEKEKKKRIRNQNRVRQASRRGRGR